MYKFKKIISFVEFTISKSGRYIVLIYYEECKLLKIGYFVWFGV